MTGLAEIADRHGRPVAGLGNPADGIVVRLHAGGLERLADQHMLVCLVGLLCRMAGTVTAIELDAPNRVLDVVTPIGRSEVGCFEVMRSLAHWAVGGLVPVVRPAAKAVGFVISLDASAPAGDVDLYATGSGWVAWVGNKAPLAAPPDSPNPLGPYFAACLVAGEVFKRVRGLKRGRIAADHGYSLWEGTTGSISELRDGPSLAEVEVPPLYLVGAGAVGQGIVTLLGAAAVPAYVVTIDDDTHDGTNLNRCFLAGVGDVKEPKIAAVQRFRGMARLRGSEFKGTLQQFVLNGPLPEMPTNMRERQARDQYEIVVSAVDRNTSRWDIRGLDPALAIGGSTDGLTAKAMVFARDLSEPCLACHNPREQDGSRRRLLEQQLRELPEEDARRRLRGEGIGEEEIEYVLAFLREAPRCGSVGDRVLGQLATSGAREFSVSFVSMAAAVLAVARLLSVTCLQNVGPRLPVMSSLSFRNLSFAQDALAIDERCDFCSGARDFQ